MSDAASNLLCSQCAYDLRDTPVEGGVVRCPECGNFGPVAEATVNDERADDLIMKAWREAILPHAVMTLLLWCLVAFSYALRSGAVFLLAVVVGAATMVLGLVLPFFAAVRLSRRAIPPSRRLASVVAVAVGSVILNVVVFVLAAVIMLQIVRR